MIRPELPILFGDIEVAHDYFFVAFKRQSDGARIGMEFSRRQREFDRARLKNILLKHTTVGYNWRGYDLPLLWLAVSGATNAELKMRSDQIITGGVKWWDVEDLVGIRIPERCDWIDLKDPQPNGDQVRPGEVGGSIFTSLKTLNGRLFGKRMQDLPFDPDARLTDADMDASNEYCMVSDLDATENVYNALAEPLEMRRVIGKDIGVDLRSKSDTQVGAAIMKKRVEEITKTRLEKSTLMRPGSTFKYPVPAYIHFQTPEMKAILERIREHNFIVNEKGKVELPEFLAKGKIELGSQIYQMGIGGLHSTEKNRAVHSDDDFVLLDGDAASYYPAITLNLGLHPASTGKAFGPAYAGIRSDRIAAKKAKDKVRDKGLKISLNGLFGLTSNRYSPFYAPHMTIAITLTGQLALLMLIERAVLAGIDVVSGNTDGLVFKCPREMFAGLNGDRLKTSFFAQITEQWEEDTGFDLEFNEYQSLYNWSVNAYYAIKADGGHKRKGAVLSNPWSPDKNDNDARAQLMINPVVTVCTDAALALIKHGTPIEDTIYNCTDVRQFVSIVNATGGGTWRNQYLGKVVRFYYSTDGAPILKKKPNASGTHPQVPKTEGCAPMMTLMDELPDDIDYARYIAETKEILMNIGFINRPPPPPKMVRLTKANTRGILLAWALAE